jgi:putative zinc finger/helix-turn-helix YgiT family protein
MEFCVACGKDRRLRHVRKNVSYEVRGETVAVEVPMTVCPVCGTEQVESSYKLDPVEVAYEEFRKRHRLLTPAQIRKIREGYGLSQKSFATLLGMSEATINRYEGGSLQEATHDNLLRWCEFPEVMADLLSRRGDLISTRQQTEVERSLAAIREGLADIAGGRTKNVRAAL